MNATTNIVTVSAKPHEVERKWYIINAEGKALGRLASEVAVILRGKRKPNYTPHVDTGDFVIIINAEKVGITGNKREDKIYYRHSGYPGGLKKRTFAELQQVDSRQPIIKAIKNMLPKTILGRKMLTKLKVYADDQHPHEAQQPEVLDIL